ncbi:MAG: hypothetical protein AAGA02_09790 [Bacteroidota bacterium]
MRIIFIFGCLITSSLFAQERYAFVHFDESNTKEWSSFLKENDEVLLIGNLSDQSKWALLNVTRAELAGLRASFNSEIVYWNQRRGEACTLEHSKKEDQLTFIKYNSHITKFNVQNAPELFRFHDQHIKEISKVGPILLEGFFDNDDGGFMLMRGTVDKEVIWTDPAVVNGIIEPEVYLANVTIGKGCN